MKNTQFKVEDVFGDIISKDKFNQEHITNPKKFFSQNKVKISFCIEINFFKPRKEKITSLLPIFVPKIIFSNLMTKTWCAGGKQYSESINRNVYKKLNPKSKKLGKVVKGKGSICGCDKSQVFSK